jgi:hypothetical protein
MKTFLFSFVLFGAVAGAQPLGAGFKIGVPLTDVYHFNKDIQTLGSFATFQANSPRYTFGPYLELRLPARMSIEIDALYRKHEFLTAIGASSTSSWEFPVVLKHKLSSGLIRPYFEGGLAFSRLSQLKSVSFNHLSNYGVVAGGGVEINALVLKISPEVRYTGWGFRNVDTAPVETRRNQFAFLVGFGF